MFKIPALSLKLFVLLWITAKRQLIHDRTASRNSWYQSYDFIVVGAGTAGCTVAHRLSENPNVRVLLLEAGGPQNAILTDMPALLPNITGADPPLQYIYFNEPQMNGFQQYPGARPTEPLGKMLGGSSSHNDMVNNRGNKRNYDEWSEKYGAKGWSYEEVLPFFKKWENNTDPYIVNEISPGYHGTNGPVRITSQKRSPQLLKLVMNAINGMGFRTIDFNGDDQIGVTFPQLFIDTNGVRASAANAYIDPNPHPHNLHILTRSLVTEILFNGVTAVGVEFVRNNITHRVYARKEVILSAGATNSPRILMLSGVGINSHLQQFGISTRIDLPVGNNYMNHPSVLLTANISMPILFQPPANLSADSLYEYYFRKSGPLSENPCVGLYFNTRGNTDPEWPNQLLYFSITNDTLVMSLSYVRPKSRGTVRLYTTNPYVQPRLDPQFLSDPLEYEEVVEAVTFVYYLLERTPIASYITIPSFESIGCPVCPNKRYMHECSEGIRCFIRFNTHSFSHPCCSTRMGAVDRDDVVVDPQLRVKNAKQLRVCDASVFPSIPNSNTNAATFMVGEKCAQMIKQYHNLGL